MAAEEPHAEVLVTTPGDDELFRSVLGFLRAATGVDFSAYRDTTIKRRIGRRLMLRGGTLAAYVERLRSDRAEVDALYQDILIKVTQFFREPEVFETLKQRVFPEILAGRSAGAPIRIWVPGCSTGQEAYSLAIALLEFLDDKPLRPPSQIFATDLSESDSLMKARAGIYPAGIEAELSPERLRRFFTQEDGGWRISKTLREMVVFARQNVAADPPFSRLDLVSCRNLLIYLSPALQKRVVPTFHYALNPGGFLLLGASETIGVYADLFAAVDQPHRVYQRKGTGPLKAYPHFRAEDHSRLPADRGAPAAPPRPMAADWQREADRVAVGEYVPPGVLIDENFEILQFRGKTGAFLAPSAGEPSHNLLKMAREGVFVAVRAAVLESRRKNAAVRQPGVRVRGEGVDREVDLQVLPVALPHAGERCFLVLFEETVRRMLPAEHAEPAPFAEEPEAHQLRQELASTREYLQSLLEQEEAANEELKSANEEILSSNEELQSTNEELETAKEELQSINEELTTVNEQLQHRNAELARLNDDTTNLIASSASAMLTLGLDMRIRRVTPAASRLLGLVPGDVGRPIGHLRTGIDLTDLATLVERVIATVQPEEREVRAPDGRACLLRVHPYRTTDNRIDGAVLSMLDIDDLRRAQTALREERDYAQGIVETVREPLVVLDAQLRVQSANGAFYSTFQVTPEDTLGRLLYDIGNRQWDIPVLRRQLGEVLSLHNELLAFEVRHEFQTIGWKVMRLGARRIVRSTPASDAILLAIEDRTDAARLEEESAAHVAHVLDEDRHKTAFLALLAHELRNPLAPIRNAIHLLSRPGTGADVAARMRDIIERQVEHLTRLVEDLLDVARINRGTIELRRQPLELAALLRDAVEMARPSFEIKGVGLGVALPQEPVVVEADPTRLSQVVGNLLGNASKFTGAGGRVTLKLERREDEAVVRVRDSGLGIAADQLTRVFDMFVQVDESLERTQGGLGLGLTLVKHLVEAHGGTVAAASEGVGHGSEFVLRLPLPGAALPAAPPTPAGPVAASGTQRRRARRILVVDDNEDGVETLAMVLSTHGHEVRTAPDGPTAIAIAAEWRPQVVLLDIGLPGMSGYDVARHISQDPARGPIRLIAVTGWGRPADRELSAAAGIDAHVVKPVDIPTLLALLYAPEASPPPAGS